MGGQGVGFGHGFDEVGLGVEGVEEEEGEDEGAGGGERIWGEMDGGVFEGGGGRGGAGLDVSCLERGGEGVLFFEQAGRGGGAGAG